MAKQRAADEEELSDKELKAEEREDLIEKLRATRQMFFAYIPKGSVGKLVLFKSKAERDEGAKKIRREMSGGTPVLGLCSGSISGKKFKLEKKTKEEDAKELGERIEKIVWRTTGLRL